MAPLFRASLLVGFIGVLASTPYFFALSVFHPVAATRTWTSLIALTTVFLAAAVYFASLYRLLGRSPYRGRLAGVFAALLTYASVALLYVFAVPAVRGQPAPQTIGFALWAFLITGWLPIAAGFFAGWLAERNVFAPSN
ncbi:MAG: hypothetical protein KF822_11290 [Steroidobacteraceae bacterium]|nr:hypothetical protein [Steroidobacteraceae bacterium]